MTSDAIGPAVFLHFLAVGDVDLGRQKADGLALQQPGLHQREHLIRRPGVLRGPRLRTVGIRGLGLDADPLAVADALAPQRFADRRQIVGMTERDDGVGCGTANRSCPWR